MDVLMVSRGFVISSGVQLQVQGKWHVAKGEGLVQPVCGDLKVVKQEVTCPLMISLPSFHS